MTQSEPATDSTTDRVTVSATAADLPPAVAAALADPPAGERFVVEAAGVPFSVLAWGDRADPPLLLIHGVTSNAEIWWRTGPALAAAGHRVLAPDLPGHGETGHWNGHHRFAEMAADVAALAGALGIAQPADRLAAMGHSWGARITACLPAAGLRPRRLILLDPVVMTLAAALAMSGDPTEIVYPTVGEALAVIRAANPTWTDGDALAKARSLTQVEEAAARAIMLDNGDWDGGLSALREPAARGVSTWIIRGDPATGSLLPDEALPGFTALVGEGRILTIAGGPHSPQRTHPEAFLAAVLEALR
jgi:pimeloyl-ACP methyl ester carboxylesterase